MSSITFVILWLQCLLAGVAYGVAFQPSDGVLLPSQITATDLLDLCAQEFDITLEYRSDVISPRGQQLTLRSDRAYSPEELWSYLHQVLEQSGSTTVIGSGTRPIYRVVPFTEAFDRASPTESTPQPVPGYVVRSYQIGGLDTEQISKGLEVLRPALGQAIVPQPNGREVLIGAVTRRHELIAEYIRESIALAVSTELVFIPVQHREREAVIASINAQTAAGEFLKPRGSIAPGPLADLVSVIAPLQDIEAWRSLIARFDLPAGVETRSYPLPLYGGDAAAGLIEEIARDSSPRGSGDQWKLIENELASTLIVTATPAEHDRVLGVLDQLAAIPPEQRQQTKTFIVKNRNADDLRESLSRLLGVSLGDQSAPLEETPGSESPRSTGGSPPFGQRDDLLLAVDQHLNAIIASGSPRLLDQVESLVTQLDVRQPQVLLEVILVSLSEGQSRDLGVEIQAQLGTSGTLVGLGSLFGLSSVSPSSSVPSVGGSGGTAVILDPGDFSVVLRALENVSEGRSVSTARTLVNNNESANLSNTVSEPYADVVFDDGDSITGFGGSETAGTKITVSPQIAEGGFLVLDYDISLSAFLGEATAGLPPSSQSTAISSVATIPDGYSIVVGGLELLNMSDTKSKTPLLGDIPVLGNLFRNNSESNSRTRFYLFIRASIMRSPGFERLRYLSDVQAKQAEVDTGWPSVQPVIIR